VSKKIGLALGGGGARGLAHLGILKVLEDNKVPIHCISGTSMGAIIGACYAVEPDIRFVDAKVRKVLSGSLFADLKIDMFSNTDKENVKGFLPRTKALIIDGIMRIIGEAKYSYLPEAKLEQFINLLLPDIDIKETELCFSCVATDLTNGKEKIFDRGSLRRTVLASSAIPGVFPPVEIDGIYYNDGGSVDVTPVKAAGELGADFIIACDVKSKVMRWEKPEKANEILNRSNYITGSLLNEYNLRGAAVVVAPAVKHIHWTGFDKIDFLSQKGLEAAEEKMPEIRKAYGKRTMLGRFAEALGINKLLKR